MHVEVASLAPVAPLAVRQGIPAPVTLLFGACVVVRGHQRKRVRVSAAPQRWLQGAARWVQIIFACLAMVSRPFSEFETQIAHEVAGCVRRRAVEHERSLRMQSARQLGIHRHQVHMSPLNLTTRKYTSPRTGTIGSTSWSKQQHQTPAPLGDPHWHLQLIPNFNQSLHLIDPRCNNTPPVPGVASDGPTTAKSLYAKSNPCKHLWHPGILQTNDYQRKPKPCFRRATRRMPSLATRRRSEESDGKPRRGVIDNHVKPKWCRIWKALGQETGWWLVQQPGEDDMPRGGGGRSRKLGSQHQHQQQQ